MNASDILNQLAKFLKANHWTWVRDMDGDDQATGEFDSPLCSTTIQVTVNVTRSPDDEK